MEEGDPLLSIMRGGAVNVDIKNNTETKLPELTFEVKKGRKGAIIEASVLNTTPVEM